MTAERYTIISADCHAGGSHKQYREYLEPRFHHDFDAWRGKYKNPFRDLGDTRRYRNWDNEMRNGQQEADGIVGEVVKSNNPNYKIGDIVEERLGWQEYGISSGTARKIVGGKYSTQLYRSSFVGFAPVSNPKIVVAVSIDEPRVGGYYGGAIAAPVFSSIVGGSLRLMGVQPDAPFESTIVAGVENAGGAR